MGKGLEKELWEYEAKRRPLEWDLSEFIRKIGSNPSWDRFVSKMPVSVKEKLIEYWFTSHSWEGEKYICKILEKLHHYSTLGYFLERLYGGQYYSPGIVKAAEAYEKAREWEDALRLYREGIEKCDPHRINVYDENTGGEVSATDFPEYNRDLIEEAENLVRKCEEKVKEMRGHTQ